MNQHTSREVLTIADALADAVDELFAGVTIADVLEASSSGSAPGFELWRSSALFTAVLSAIADYRRARTSEVNSDA